jgi:hypothetical protein
VNTNPVYSPYINLLRTGSFMNNYFGLVQPELEFRNAVFNLQGQVSANRQGLTDLSTGLVPTTGHPIYFLNTSRYFLVTGGRQATGGRQQGAGGPTPRSAVGGLGGTNIGGTGSTSYR